MIQMQRYSALLYTVQAGQGKFGRVGHTLIQKLFYLLIYGKNVPLGYKFKLYYYGPYCAEIWGDLNTIKDYGLISIQPKPDGFGYDIAPGNKTWPSLKEFASAIAPKIDELLDLLGGQHVRMLEVLATTHYVYTDWKKRDFEPSPDSVAESVVALKPHLTVEEAKQALALLKREKLC
ncbi:MAG: hypothetical protein M1299_07615 [Firmicutes bacterium]|nr:hypothetical protein [Bacillota bacterium]MCL5039670.1 hypothetical protein [Bacillota bacterium]